MQRGYVFIVQSERGRYFSEGNYEIPYLLPGTYRVTAELAGFSKSVRDNVELRTADRLALNFQLQVGALSESVTVSAETPLLETTSASSGLVMDERRVRGTPRRRRQRHVPHSTRPRRHR